VQLAAEGHETAFRKKLSAGPAGSGVGWIAHVRPFQRSASVRASPELSEYCPAAVHLVAEEHEIPERKLSDEPGGLGVDWIAHVRPFHRSASVDTSPALSV
jgi:hypothetical protein